MPRPRRRQSMGKPMIENPTEYAREQFSKYPTDTMLRLLRERKPQNLPEGFIAAVADRLEELDS